MAIEIPGPAGHPPTPIKGGLQDIQDPGHSLVLTKTKKLMIR